MFVGLNPSTADAAQDDATIRRCIEFARTWGYGALVMTNLFAWRATDPGDMLAAADPVGPDNDAALLAAARAADVVVAAWGVHGAHMGRDVAVRAMLPRLHYLRLTKDGRPGHPLYLPADLRPTEWPAGPAQNCRPATELQVVRAEPNTENLPDLPTCTESQTRIEARGTPRTLHDGRQVDSWSAEWRMECLASTLLQLGGAERDEWIRGYGTPEAQQELRLRIRAVQAARRRV